MVQQPLPHLLGPDVHGQLPTTPVATLQLHQQQEEVETPLQSQLANEEQSDLLNLQQTDSQAYNDDDQSIQWSQQDDE